MATSSTTNATAADPAAIAAAETVADATLDGANRGSLRPADLLRRLRAVYTTSGACGARIHSQTSARTLQDGPVEFVLRVLPSLAKKPAGAAAAAANGANACAKAPPRTPNNPPANPFLPYDERLFVSNLSPTHCLLLNKFDVAPLHALVVTRQFQPQTDPLRAADLEATFLALAAFRSAAASAAAGDGGGAGGDGSAALAFYNCGEHSGRSQPHKHVQVVPLPFATAEERRRQRRQGGSGGGEGQQGQQGREEDEEQAGRAFATPQAPIAAVVEAALLEAEEARRRRRAPVGAANENEQQQQQQQQPLFVELRAFPFRAYAAPVPAALAAAGEGEEEEQGDEASMAAAAEELERRLQAMVARCAADCGGNPPGGGGPSADGGSAPSVSYNLLLTERWVVAVPRRRERDDQRHQEDQEQEGKRGGVGGVGANALAFAGTLLCRDDAELSHVGGKGPMAVLRDVGWPW
jgi:ATP adenylyltransferase/5',5'''-P-1,P-4-tetraphosphate phosphorylase II